MGSVTIGVDLGGTKVQTVVFNGDEVLGQDRLLTPHSGADDVVATIQQSITTSLTNASVDGKDVAAIGVGAPGRIAAGGTVSHSPNIPGFDSPVELGPRLSQLNGGVGVKVENDVRVAMIGEKARGAARPFTDVLAVFMGTGVGGGLVLEGKLRDGRGAAGEVGHIIVKPDGRTCGCGRHGHLEAYAGRGSMEKHARKRVGEGEKTILFELMEERGRTTLNSGAIVKAAEQDDRVANELLDDAVWAMSIGLATIQNLLDLQAFVIGGGLGDRLGQPFIDRVVDKLQPLLFVPENAPQVIGSELKDMSGAIGAAVLAATD